MINRYIACYFVAGVSALFGLAIMLRVLEPKPVAVDAWTFTDEDAKAAYNTFLNTSGNIDGKLYAALKNDRATLKARVTASTPTTPAIPATPAPTTVRLRSPERSRLWTNWRTSDLGTVERRNRRFRSERAVNQVKFDVVNATLYRCRTCKFEHGNSHLAESCCHCRDCGRSLAGESRGSFVRCSECWRKEQARVVDRYAAEAEEIKIWAGSVYDPATDRYFDSIDEVDLDKNGRPEWVYPCDPESFVDVSWDWLFDTIASDSYEDFDEYDLTGVAEFKVAIDAFNEANKKVVRLIPDMKKKIRVVASPVESIAGDEPPSPEVNEP